MLFREFWRNSALSEYVKQNLCRSSGTCENNECLCENLRSQCYELGVLQLPKKVTKCGKRFFKEECMLLNNNQAIPQIQAEETHEKQGFCASRDNTESLHEEYTQLGNNKKSSLLEEVVEEAEREDLQRKLAAELSFRL